MMQTLLTDVQLFKLTHKHLITDTENNYMASHFTK